MVRQWRAFCRSHSTSTAARLQARSLRWKQLLLRTLKPLLVDSASEAAVAAPGTDAAAFPICTPSSTWFSTAVLSGVLAVGLLHVALSAAARAVLRRRRRKVPKWLQGDVATLQKEALVLLAVLPGARRSRLSRRTQNNMAATAARAHLKPRTCSFSCNERI